MKFRGSCNSQSEVLCNIKSGKLKYCRSLYDLNIRAPNLIRML